MSLSLSKLFPRMLVIPLILTLVTLYAFIGTLENDFVDFDDSIYIYNNFQVQQGITVQNIKWAFTEGTKVSNYWHPITWLSHMLDCHLYGLKPEGHHLTNILLHTLTTLLIFCVFKSVSKGVWRSAFISGLFALHPLHVECVAWISQRKDLLCAFFWFLTLYAYFRYTRNKTVSNYLLVLVFLILGAMSKPMIVTLPFVLLLLDYWPLNRWSPVFESIRGKRRLQIDVFCHLIWEKAPFFLLILFTSTFTYITQDEGGAFPLMNKLPFAIRIGNAFLSYGQYIIKMVFPHDLAVFYPHYGHLLPLWKAVASGIMLLLVSYLFIWRLRRYRYLAVGWLWYLGTLIPVIGLVQVGSFAMADRYTYIPLTGLFIIIVFGGGDIVKKYSGLKKILPMFMIILLIVFLFMTKRQVTFWKNSLTLFEHTYRITPENILILNSLGVACYTHGRPEDSLFYYNRVLQIDPNNAMSHMRLGILWADSQKYDLALYHLKKSIQIEPTALRYMNLGNTYAQMGQNLKAMRCYQEGLKLDANYLALNYNTALLYHSMNKPAMAIHYFQKVLHIYPMDWRAHNSIGVEYTIIDEFSKAFYHFSQALKYNPDSKRVQENIKKIQGYLKMPKKTNKPIQN